MWFLANLIVILPGLLIGMGGLIILNVGQGSFMNNSGNGHVAFEDQIAWVLFVLNAPALIGGPIYWAWCCWRCRRGIQMDDPMSALAGQKLCRWALAGGVNFAVGVLYGLGKGIGHRRWGEAPYWITILFLTGCYILAVLFTHRLLRQVEQELKSQHSPGPAAIV